MGELLRALGQNPTQAEVTEIVHAAPSDGELVAATIVAQANAGLFLVDYKTFLTILNRPDGFKPAGTPGQSPFHLISVPLLTAATEEFIRGFQVFDKDRNGFIGAGELRYVLTQLGEKMSDAEVEELLKGVQIGADGNINYESFVRTILSQ